MTPSVPPARRPPSSAFNQISANRLAAQAPAAQKPGMTQSAQVYVSAYAREFSLAPAEGGATLPLAQQRVSGGFTMRDGLVTVPADGYYMLLWELDVEEAQGSAQLHLGINGSGVQLTHCMQPGYDAAQQVTWLNEGDKLRLFIKGSGKFKCASTMLTIIRLG